MKALFFLMSSLFLSMAFMSCNENDDTDTISTINFTGSSIGCANFNIYVFENDESSQTVLSINGVSKEDLGLTVESKTFQLPDPKLNIEISTWDISVASYFCNDVAIDPTPQKTDTWSLVSGTATLSISNVVPSQIPEVDNYTIHVFLENLIFEDSEGDQIKMEDLDLQDISVGWLPG